MEYYKTLDECIPDGQDFQNWVMRTHLKIHPKIIEKQVTDIDTLTPNIIIDFSEIVDNEKKCEICDEYKTTAQDRLHSNQVWCDDCNESQIQCIVCECWMFNDDGNVCDDCQESESDDE
jgi:hypothetical protein